MCYVEKLVDFWSDGTERDFGPDFDGKFDCARYNCRGCAHRLFVGEEPKRNQGVRISFSFINFIFEKS